MREVEALGFAQVTVRGHGGNAEYRIPNKFRLTYRPTDSAGPTDEWKRFSTIEEAKQIALAARKSIRRGRLKNGAVKNKKPVGKNTSSVLETPTEKPEPPMGETPTTAKVGNPPLLSIFRGGARHNHQMR